MYIIDIMIDLSIIVEIDRKQLDDFRILIEFRN